MSTPTEDDALLVWSMFDMNTEQCQAAVAAHRERAVKEATRETWTRYLAAAARAQRAEEALVRVMGENATLRAQVAELQEDKADLDYIDSLREDTLENNMAIGIIENEWRNRGITFRAAIREARGTT